MPTLGRQRFFLLVLMLVATSLLARLADNRPASFLALPLDSIDTQIANWQVSSTQTLGAGVLKALVPTSYLARTYKKGSDNLDLFISFYAQQRSGEAMHSPKACLPGSGWEIWKYGSATIPVNGEGIKINKYFIQNMGQRLIVYYWYQSKHRIIASEYLGKVLLVHDVVFTGNTAGSIVRLTVKDRSDLEMEGQTFAAQLIPQVRRCFGQ